MPKEERKCKLTVYPILNNCLVVFLNFYFYCRVVPIGIYYLKSQLLLGHKLTTNNVSKIECSKTLIDAFRSLLMLTCLRILDMRFIFAILYTHKNLYTLVQRI